MAVTGTFTAVGSSNEIVIARGKAFHVEISGTFVASVQIEKKIGTSAWGVVKTFTDLVDQTWTGLDGTFRIKCASYTSGTVSYSLEEELIIDADLNPFNQELNTGDSVEFSYSTLTRPLGAGYAGTVSNGEQIVKYYLDSDNNFAALGTTSNHPFGLYVNDLQAMAIVVYPRENDTSQVVIGEGASVLGNSLLTVGAEMTAVEYHVPDGFGSSHKVIGSRKSGWGVPTGTLSRATFATYTAPDISAAYTESEVQAIADHLQVVSRTLAALLSDLHAQAATGHSLLDQ